MKKTAERNNNNKILIKKLKNNKKNIANFFLLQAYLILIFKHLSTKNIFFVLIAKKVEGTLCMLETMKSYI